MQLRFFSLLLLAGCSPVNLSIDLSENIYFVSENGELNQVENLPLQRSSLQNPDSPLHFIIQIPEHSFKEPAIYFNGIYEVFRFEFRNQKLEYGTVENGQSQHQGYPWHLISLNTTNDSTESSIANLYVHSDLKSAGPYGEILLGEYSDLKLRIVYTSIDGFLVGSILVIISLIGFIVAMFLKTRGLYISFAIIAAALGLYVLSRSPMRLLFWDWPLFWTFLNLSLIYIMPALFASFYLQAFPGIFRRLLKSILFFSLIYAAIALPLTYTRAVNWETILQPYQWFILILMPALIAPLFSLIKNKSKEGYILLGGLSIFLVLAAHDNLAAQGIIPYRLSVAQWGVLALALSMASVAGVRTAETFRKMAEYALRLENINRDIEIARKTQQSLLPENLPELPGLKAASLFLAAEEISGDFFDYHPVSKSEIGVLVSDVSGHGIPAAIFSVSVKMAFSREIRLSHHPGLLLSSMNHSLYGTMGNQYLTAIYCHFDTYKMTVKYATAGHPPGYLLRKKLLPASTNDIVNDQTSPIQQDTQFSGLPPFDSERTSTGLEENHSIEVIPLKTRGTIVGMLETNWIQEQELKLHPGDRIVLTTDGVSDLRRNRTAGSDVFGDERFIELMKTYIDSPGSTCLNILESELKHFSQGRFEDDITVLIIDITES